MAAQRLRQVLRQLHSSVETLSDAQLLSRFVAARDETAFAALVRRHGRMVMGVSRRILGHVQDAEDVFQATFLVLARQAHAVVRRETIGSWLYRVAYRTALDAKAVRARRRVKEGQVHDVPEPEVPPMEVQDWRAILQEEINALPEKYQTPIVLCDLESRSRKEAAEQMRIPEGTLSSRLAKARRTLAVRLARRGITLACGALAAALARDALAGPVTGPLVGDTVRIATLMLSGQLATVSSPVALLMKGALKTMFMARFKVVGALIVTACLSLGVGSVAYRPAEAQNSPAAAKPINELEALRRENALLKLNLEVVLEKVKAQAAELKAAKKAAAVEQARALYAREVDLAKRLVPPSGERSQAEPPQLPIEIEDFLAKLRMARNDSTRAAYAEALGGALRQYRLNLKKKKTSPPRK